METATYIALSRQSVLLKSMDLIANNVANASTTGFRAHEPLFETYLARTPGGRTLAYVQDGGTRLDTTAGDLSPTGNPLDVGIDGGGYFTIGTAAGTRYSRAGRFQIDGQNQLVTAAGDKVLDDGGQPITLPRAGATVSIDATGTVSANGQRVAKLGLVDFADESQLQAEGGALFSTSQAATPDTGSHLEQGVLESSNVKPVVEMTKLLELQRAYTSAQQVLDDEDSRLKSAIDKLSKVS